MFNSEVFYSLLSSKHTILSFAADIDACLGHAQNHSELNTTAKIAFSLQL